MKIHLTAPDIPSTPTEDRLWLHWKSFSRPLLPWRAFPDQSHEALLQEIWNNHRRFAKGGKALFSDLDFIPYQDALDRVEKDLDRYRAVFVPYFTRDSYGYIKHPFFTALWFWAVNTEGIPKSLWPPYDWIRTIGRPLDVGAGGFLHLVSSGFCKANEIKFYDGDPCQDAERTGWVEYPDLGVHVFNHRNFAEPQKVLDPFGITVADHLANINRWLDRV